MKFSAFLLADSLLIATSGLASPFIGKSQVSDLKLRSTPSLAPRGYWENAAGVSLESAPSDHVFSRVAGIFRVPDISIPSGGKSNNYSIILSLSIDSMDTNGGGLAAGVAMGIGLSTYTTLFYSWIGDDPVFIPDVPVTTGDTISLIVTKTPGAHAKSGSILIHNESTDKWFSANTNLTQDLVDFGNGAYELNGQNVHWAVQATYDNDLPKFGDEGNPVQFYTCWAGINSNENENAGILNQGAGSTVDLTLASEDTLLYQSRLFGYFRFPIADKPLVEAAISSNKTALTVWNV